MKIHIFFNRYPSKFLAISFVISFKLKYTASRSNNNIILINNWTKSNLFDRNLMVKYQNINLEHFGHLSINSVNITSKKSSIKKIKYKKINVYEKFQKPKKKRKLYLYYIFFFNNHPFWLNVLAWFFLFLFFILIS